MDKKQIQVGVAVLKNQISRKNESLKSKHDWMVQISSSEPCSYNYKQIASFALECRDMVLEIIALNAQLKMLEEVTA